MPDPPQLARARGRAARLARIEAEFDRSVEARSRRAIVGLILLPGVVLVCMLALAPLRQNSSVTFYASIFAHRLSSVRAATPTTGVINGDMGILLASSAAATIGITRDLWPAPAARFVGILTGSLFAPLHTPAYAASALFALGYFALVWGRLRGSSLPRVGRG